MDTDRQELARQQALELSQRKDSIESEMDAIYESLTVRFHCCFVFGQTNFVISVP